MPLVYPALWEGLEPRFFWAGFQLSTLELRAMTFIISSFDTLEFSTNRQKSHSLFTKRFDVKGSSSFTYPFQYVHTLFATVGTPWMNAIRPSIIYRKLDVFVGLWFNQRRIDNRKYNPCCKILYLLFLSRI